PLNNLILNCNEKTGGYSFFVAGHIYGSHNKSIYPAASILANISLLNNAGAGFMVLLGDIVQRSSGLEIEVLKNSFLAKLNFPVFNAPGNHEMTNRKLYEEYFGKTFFSFQYSTELFIFLDSEISDGKLETGQLEFMMKNIELCRKSSRIKNIFVFSHRLLWAIENEPYNRIIPFVNYPLAHHNKANTISAIILPQLKSLAGKNVYFVSGDVGCYWSLPLFYQKDTTSNITYVAVGIGDTQKDLICRVIVNKSGKVIFSPISLTGAKLDYIECYGLDYWERYFRQKQGIKVLAKIKNKLDSSGVKYFWAVLGLSALLIIILKRRN
ncbi:metallophosphoesterase, partial [bacterium]|nr:metallophosphoesterase [bacterium]